MIRDLAIRSPLRSKTTRTENFNHWNRVWDWKWGLIIGSGTENESPTVTRPGLCWTKNLGILENRDKIRRSRVKPGAPGGTGTTPGLVLWDIFSPMRAFSVYMRHFQHCPIHCCEYVPGPGRGRGTGRFHTRCPRPGQHRVFAGKTRHDPLFQVFIVRFTLFFQQWKRYKSVKTICPHKFSARNIQSHNHRT